MAELDKSVIGKLRGRIGDVVFRQRNGKVFVSQRPKSFMPGTDEKSVERRSKFAFCAKLSKAIYSIPELSCSLAAGCAARKIGLSLHLTN